MRRLAVTVSAALACSGLLVLSPYAAAPASAAELIGDGGFESATGNPLNSPSWTEADSERTSPLCSKTLCPTSASVAPPRNGVNWIVFGARNSGSHTASMSQAVTIPAGGTASLTYWYRSAEVSSPFTATVTVKVDGTTLKTHTETSTPESAYSQQTVSLNAYTNGASHTISFNYSANGSSSSQRLVIDDVSLNYTAAVTATPTVSSTNPSSPSNSTKPLVKGTAESGSTVTLYSNSSCTSTALGSGTQAAFAGSGITATVPANATTTIWAKATKSGQTASACSSTSVTYTNDSTAPARPTLTSVSPASPSTSTTPSVSGTAEAGSTVKLYTSATCTGSPVAAGTAAAFASPGLSATVALGSTTTFRATATDAAGNISACSTSTVGYKADLRDGGFEAATGSPADSPDWLEADSLAGSPLCTVATCEPGPEIAPHSGSAWVWFGGFADAGHTGSLAQAVTLPTGPLALTFWYRNSSVSAPYDAQLVVRVDGVTLRTIIESSEPQQAYAQQVVDLSAFADGKPHVLSFDYTNGQEGVNNMLVDDVSLRATVGARATTPTVAPFTTPASPSTSTTPKVIGTAAAGATVVLYANAACTGAVLGSGPAADFAAGGITAFVPGGTTTIHAKAVQAGLDDSTCSTSFASYTRLGPPETALVKTPKKTVRTHKKKATVVFTFAASTAGATFECSVDGRAFTACGSGAKLRLRAGKHTFAVRAVALGMPDLTPATYSFKVKRRK